MTVGLGITPATPSQKDAELKARKEMWEAITALLKLAAEKLARAKL